jgi:hypothetical protein
MNYGYIRLEFSKGLVCCNLPQTAGCYIINFTYLWYEQE